MTPIRILALTILIASPAAFADAITLRNGKTIVGKNVLMSTQEVAITRCGATERYPRTDVQSVDFSQTSITEPCGAPINNIPEFPAGTAVDVRLLDYIDSSHEPPGQTFRGALDRALTLDGRVIASAGARTIVKMTTGKGDLGQTVQTLELVAVETGKEWSVVKTGAAPDLEQVNGSDAVLKGLQLVAPSKTRVRFTFKSSLRLNPESDAR